MHAIPGDDHYSSRRAILAILLALSAAMVGVLPVFLVGALTTQLRDELNVGPFELGVAAATLFGVTGILARPLGRMVQRVGPFTGIAISAAVATMSLVIVSIAESFSTLILALCIGGIANGTAQPAANYSISRSIGSRHLGLAFGVKQSSVPAANMLSGLAIPSVALLVGWRSAFALAAVLAVGIGLSALVSRRWEVPIREAGTPLQDRGTPRVGLVVLTIGAGLAAAAATAAGVFVIDSGVRTGISPEIAGLVVAGSALLGLLTRVALGAMADRFPRRSVYVLIANLVLLGSGGFVFLSTGNGILFGFGALIVYCAAWAWPGLLHFVVIRDNRQTAAATTGIVQSGMSLGAAAGPLVFGLLVELYSYGTAWLFAGAAGLVASGTIRLGRRLIRRSRAAPPRAI